MGAADRYEPAEAADDEEEFDETDDACSIVGVETGRIGVARVICNVYVQKRKSKPSQKRDNAKEKQKQKRTLQLITNLTRAMPVRRVSPVVQ